jgi:hypothetical protein
MMGRGIMGRNNITVNIVHQDNASSWTSAFTLIAV